MRAYYATPLGPMSTAIGAAFASFTARQDISALPCGVLPANACEFGTKIKIEAEGEFSTTGTPTLALGLYAGTPGTNGAPSALTSIFAESAAITTGSGAASWQWRLEYKGTITAVGTTGSIVGCGNLELGTSLTAITSVPIPITLALRTVTLNTLVANAIGVCATWGTSSASNTIKTYNCLPMLLN